MPRPTQADNSERGLSGLTGPGPTQVDVVAAMRARDAARPTAEDLARAETELVILRRNWQPPA
ncbi:MAG: hypothetical protein H0T85_02610 [Geodermatophilaceae bacterium]|nr:hypothetical protein [Geodermatophilaceae bacterium]